MTAIYRNDAMTLQLSAERILARIEALARHSQEGPGVTRLYLSPELRGATDQLLAWMAEAGVDAHVDAVGNVVGRYHARSGRGPYLLIGSHLDSVIQGGKYDGPLGVLTALECVHALHQAGRRLDFGIELLGFADEEGARFPATLIGSRAVAGTFQESTLEARDANGVSIREAMSAYGLDPSLIPSAAHERADVLAYLEFHIEQGPVLESEHLPVGVVTAINGQSRMLVTMESAAGHAGTVPMHLRHDPLLAACAIALAVERISKERPNTVGTVGQVTVRPGAMNVIPDRRRSASMFVRRRTRTDVGCWIGCVPSWRGPAASEGSESRSCRSSISNHRRARPGSCARSKGRSKLKA
jgi:allantoate deiminase